MSLQKPLCWICECPTAGGAVQAVHVDMEKLQAWALNVCGHEFAEQIEDHDLICFFCVWHAQTLAENDEDLVWWPKNFVLDDAAELLCRSYFEGRIEQCWVQLEKIELPVIEVETEQRQEMKISSDAEREKIKRKNCLYCCKSYNNENSLREHIRNKHKNAIRCETPKCATYFHTVEEKEKHSLEIHEKSKERKVIIKCNFCDKKFERGASYRLHVRNVHKDFSMKCAMFGCLSYFQTETEMEHHLDSYHSCSLKFHCDLCDFKTKQKSSLSEHVVRKHLPKNIKCNHCDKMLSSRKALQAHKTRHHIFKKCILCKTEVPAAYKMSHLRVRKCVHCKNKFDCLGLLREHLKVCVRKNKILIKCEKCGKSFKWIRSMQHHMKTMHKIQLWSGVEHQKLGFKCEPCKRYYKSAKFLKMHLNYKHSSANLKQCAHCDASFRVSLQLKRHLAGKHGLIEGDFKCDECKERFVSKCFLRKHFLKHVKTTPKRFP